MVEGILGMSVGERERLVMVRQVVDKQLSQRVLSERLGIGVRQVKRLVRAYRANGAVGLVSKQRGRVSNHQLLPGVSERVLGLLREKYQGFGPTLAAEKLLECEAIAVSRETLRRLQIEHGLWKPKRRQQKRLFQLRERRPRFGELIQIDASPHDWFEGRAERCALIVFIDDATSRLTALQFAPCETTAAYLAAVKTHVLAHGTPLAFYSDRHGIFRVNAKDARSGDGLTAFGRVAQRLDIEAIHAQTPQAKGRVERANQTLQDRLVKEMRLKGISSIEAAQGFVPEFMASWNKRFEKPPRNTEDAHRPWNKGTEALDEALAKREDRSLSKALTFSSAGQLYCIKTKDAGIALRGAKVTLLHFLDQSLKVRYKDRELDFTAVRNLPIPASAEDEKTIDTRVNAILSKIRISKPGPGYGQVAG